MVSRRELGLTGALAAVALAGCGGGARQDAHEASGTYKVQVVRATFPAKQRIAQATQMRIEVRNSGNATIPDLAVTVDSFNHRVNAPGIADPTSPIWIVDSGPSGGQTAYNNTWALGPLPPGQARTFTWHLTAIDAGTFRVRYHVAAGLNGKAVAQLDNGSAPQGTWSISVTNKPLAARVDPNTGRIVRPADSSSAGSNATSGGGASSSGGSSNATSTAPPPGY